MCYVSTGTSYTLTHTPWDDHYKKHCYHDVYMEVNEVAKAQQIEVRRGRWRIILVRNNRLIRLIHLRWWLFARPNTFGSEGSDELYSVKMSICLQPKHQLWQGCLGKMNTAHKCGTLQHSIHWIKGGLTIVYSKSKDCVWHNNITRQSDHASLFRVG